MGRTPKSTAQHHVDGTFHATRHKDRKNEPVVAGKPVKPRALRGRASTIWNEYARIAYWLTSADSHSLMRWCMLAAESEKNPEQMISSRISVMNSLGAQLGLNGPASRTRINVLGVPGPVAVPESPNPPNDKETAETDPGSKYFN